MPLSGRKFMNPDTRVMFDDPARIRKTFLQNGFSRKPIPLDENAILNYLFGSKIGNITKGTAYPFIFIFSWFVIVSHL